MLKFAEGLRNFHDFILKSEKQIQKVLTIFALKSGDSIDQVMQQLLKDRQIRGINNQFGVQAKLDKKLSEGVSPAKGHRGSMLEPRSPMRSPMRSGRQNSGLRKGSALYKDRPWAKTYQGLREQDANELHSIFNKFGDDISAINVEEYD